VDQIKIKQTANVDQIDRIIINTSLSSLSLLVIFAICLALFVFVISCMRSPPLKQEQVLNNRAR